MSDETKPWYNQSGGCVEYKKNKNELEIGEYIDPFLTIYRSYNDPSKIIGYQINHVLILVKNAMEASFDLKEEYEKLKNDPEEMKKFIELINEKLKVEKET